MTLHAQQPLRHTGVPLPEARAAVVLLHGRGASADDILTLAERLPQEGIAYLAPSAAHGTWYPQRFLAPPAQNEPWLGDALRVVDELVQRLHAGGLGFDRIGLAGFSQGACLALEYAARHPRRYGFVAGLSGALIGPLDARRAPLDLAGTPVLVSCAEEDAHIPRPFVEHTARVLGAGHAVVTQQLFPGGAHTIFGPQVWWLERQVEALGRNERATLPSGGQ